MEVNNRTILLVNDYPEHSAEVIQYLQLKGYNIIHLPFEKEIFEIFNFNSLPNLFILMDIGSMEEKEFSAIENEIFKDYEIPVIFLSYNPGKEIAEQIEKKLFATI